MSSHPAVAKVRRAPRALARRVWRYRVAGELDRAGLLADGEPEAAAAHLTRGLRSLRDLQERGILSSPVGPDEPHRIEALVRFAADLEAAELMGPLSVGIDDWAPFLRFAGPGHFYSPIPSRSEIERVSSIIYDRNRAAIPGVDLRVPEQLALFAELADLVRDADVPDDATEGHRYHAANFAFGIGDGLMLHGMLRRLRPQRVIEIGSGFSSALILDTASEHLPDTRLTFIDPYPELVRSLLWPGDEARARIIAEPVQLVDPAVFAALEEGDVLFVDLSHVVKVGSDTTHVLLEVLPTLRPGVVVHLHDIFWPFFYPRVWVEEGRAWGEVYLLRALLCDSDAWEVQLWNDWLAYIHRDVIGEHLPRMLANPGGSIWLRRAG